MNELIALALRRAGVNTLAEFQALQGLPQTGEADPETQLALEPYLLGFRTIRIQPGDTYWELAARYGTTSQAIATANPSLDPERLPVGAPMRVPLGFPVVPTDVPMTSNLCSLCIRGLVGRYPGLCRMEALTTTAFGRPVEALTMGSGQRRVLYTAAHHANEWITATLLLAFAEDLAKAAMAGAVIGGYPGRELLEVATCRRDPGGPGPVRLHQHLRHSHHSGGERICFLHRGQDFGPDGIGHGGKVRHGEPHHPICPVLHPLRGGWRCDSGSAAALF